MTFSVCVSVQRGKSSSMEQGDPKYHRIPCRISRHVSQGNRSRSKQWIEKSFIIDIFSDICCGIIAPSFAGSRGVHYQLGPSQFAQSPKDQSSSNGETQQFPNLFNDHSHQIRKDCVVELLEKIIISCSQF